MKKSWEAEFFLIVRRMDLLVEGLWEGLPAEKQKVWGNSWQEKLNTRGNQNYFIMEKLNKLFKDPAQEITHLKKMTTPSVCWRTKKQEMLAMLSA